MDMLDFVFDTFIPADLPESDEILLKRLDRLTGAGLSHAEFRRVFVQCGICGVMTARRNAHFHRCGGILAPKTSTLLLDQTQVLFCTGVEGLESRSFEVIFSFCGICERYMTRSTSINHNCVFEARYSASFTAMS